MLRGEWFAALASIVTALALVRLVARRPLIPDRARGVSTAAATLALVSIALLVFHCTAMFAPDAVAAVRILDGPAAVVRDLSDRVGQAAYWLPAAALVLAAWRLWWPAPVALTLTLAAVGWTMYGDFTVTEHVTTIVAAGVAIGLIGAGLVRPGQSERQVEPSGTGR